MRAPLHAWHAGQHALLLPAGQVIAVDVWLGGAKILRLAFPIHQLTRFESVELYGTPYHEATPSEHTPS
jgi:hypothetical protein